MSVSYKYWVTFLHLSTISNYLHLTSSYLAATQLSYIALGATLQRGSYELLWRQRQYWELHLH